jgi:hypothetical protein
MPSLDSCIASIFEPGNIATDSGAITVPKFGDISATATQALSIGQVATALTLPPTLTATQALSIRQVATALTLPPPITTFATFDGTPSAGVTKSNGDLTITHGTSNNGAGCFTTTALSTGKFYFEIVVQVSTSSSNGSGIKPYVGGAFSDPGATFAGGTGVLYGSPNSFIYTNGSSTSKNLGITAIGDVFGFAIDLAARLAWCRRNGGNWNGDAAANPATGTNGVIIPAGTMAPMVRFTNSGPTNAMTANFGQSAFAFTPPSGFRLGWGT